MYVHVTGWPKLFTQRLLYVLQDDQGSSYRGLLSVCMYATDYLASSYRGVCVCIIVALEASVCDSKWSGCSYRGLCGVLQDDQGWLYRDCWVCVSVTGLGFLYYSMISFCVCYKMIRLVIQRILCLCVCYRMTTSVYTEHLVHVLQRAPGYTIRGWCSVCYRLTRVVHTRPFLVCYRMTRTGYINACVCVDVCYRTIKAGCNGSLPGLECNVTGWPVLFKYKAHTCWVLLHDDQGCASVQISFCDV